MDLMAMGIPIPNIILSPGILTLEFAASPLPIVNRRINRTTNKIVSPILIQCTMGVK
jgi:hypothetical protein